MKKIELKEVVVKKLDPVDEAKYYGVKVANTKGFVIRENYDEGCFKVISSRLCTNGNHFTVEPNESLSGLLEEVASCYNWTIYEFPTHTALFVWIAS